MSPVIELFENPEAVAHAAAERFVTDATSSIARDGRFAVALAGGSTPKRSYELLAGDSYCKQVDWLRVHLFFGDERAVFPDSEESNFRMVNDALIARVPIPSENVHRIKGELEPVEGANLYEEELKAFFRNPEWPRFDLAFLGMGKDGHTASLFPKSKSLREEKAWVTITDEVSPARITLTLPAINHAKHILFLVTGREKAETIAEVLQGNFKPDGLPAQRIQPVDGKLEWLIDADAASRFSKANF